MPNILRDLDESVLLSALMENVADSIYFKDRDCRLVWVSQKMVTDLGYKDSSQILGKTDADLFGEEFSQKTLVDDLGVMESGKPVIGRVESRVLPNGKINWTSTSKLPIHNKTGEVIGLLGITREINELKQVEQDLQYLATHDVLTTLPNRFLLYDALDQAVKRAKRNKGQFAILYLDLDGFKLVNDRHGHDVGDKVLKQGAARLLHCVREADRVARLGGDEFAVLLEDISGLEDAARVAEKIRKAIARPYESLPKKMKVTASIGISLFPKHGKNSATLLSAADRAMYKAKAKGNSVVAFSLPKKRK